MHFKWSVIVLGFGIGLYSSRNCSGGGMIMSSYSLTICTCLTLLRGLGTGFLILVPGTGIGLYPSRNCSGGWMVRFG